MTPAQTLALAFGLPFAGAALVGATGRRPNVREAVTLLTSVVLLVVVAGLVPLVLSGDGPALTLVQVLPGLTLAFKLEPLGMLFALVASTLWIATSVYAIGYMRAHHEVNQTRFFVCFALAIGAALGVAFSGNLFTLFVFYEMLTLSTVPLVTHAGTEEAKRAGRVYLGILLSTSIGFLLTGVILTYICAGTLDFRLGGILRDHVSPAVLPFLLALFAFGIGKAALMPFHRWLPAAMVAPTPVSALLHAVAVVKAGVFAMLKVSIYVFGTDYLRETGASDWLAWTAGATILLASLVAITKDNLKARLAYSTVSQLAYIVLGAALATKWGIVGGGMHIAMHAFGKITLFFCAGAIFVTAHKTEISTLDGIGRRMPLTMFAFFIGALSVIGVPPLGGSWSKWFLLMGAADAHQIGLMCVLLASSLLNVGYLMPIPVRAFFAPPAKDAHAHGDGHDGGHASAGDHGDADADVHGDGHGDGHGGHGGHGGIHEAPAFCLVPLCVTAACCVVLFFLAPWIVELLAPIAGGLR